MCDRRRDAARPADRHHAAVGQPAGCATSRSAYGAACATRRSSSRSSSGTSRCCRACRRRARASRSAAASSSMSAASSCRARDAQSRGCGCCGLVGGAVLAHAGRSGRLRVAAAASAPGRCVLPAGRRAAGRHRVEGLDRPALQGFNFTGGVRVPPELVALWAGPDDLCLGLHRRDRARLDRGGAEGPARGRPLARADAGPTLFLVVLPQALRIMVPPLTSQYLNIIKSQHARCRHRLSRDRPDLRRHGDEPVRQRGRGRS